MSSLDEPRSPTLSADLPDIGRFGNYRDLTICSIQKHKAKEVRDVFQYILSPFHDQHHHRHT